MKHRLITLIIAGLVSTSAFAQLQSADTVKRPKLVVGIVIDQMRWDYLYKFYSLFDANGGFKRLLNDGFSCENTFIPYTPTVTAAGHTSIYSGSVPAVDGIVGNTWYDKFLNKEVYCSDDDSVKTVGANDSAGKMSPKNLVVTTITDELRVATNYASKVIGISIKDRAAIFPAGHVANAAYWFDPAVGKFISSTYYINALPEWLNNFNNRKLPDSLYNLNWNLSLPEDVYKKYCGEDAAPYERKPFGADQQHFPYKLSVFAKKDYSKLAITPQGNSLLEALAETTIKNENLGNNGTTDFLAVSFSSPDYIGHTFGPESWEQLDDYVKLDKVLGSFFSFLDKQVGNGNYLVFLTADHGVANSAGYSTLHKLPGGTFNDLQFFNSVSQGLLVNFKSANIIKSFGEDQLTLNDKVVDSLNVNRDSIINFIVNYAEKFPGIARAFALKNISTTTLTAVQKQMYSNTYYPTRSGDIQLVLRSGYMAGDGLGTTHGLWNPYDAHIPLLWYGWNIKPGKTNRETYMTDISATLAAILHIQMPSGCVGKVIEEITR